MVPAAPRACSHLARAVSRASAVNTSAGGSSRPARAALPDASSQTVTAASARASSRRRPAASGSAARTARRSAARSCPVVHPPAPARPRYRPAMPAAAPSSASTASSSANTAAFAQSIPPAFNAVRTSGVRARAEAMVRSRPADRPVRVSAAAISSVTCSACRDPAGPGRGGAALGEGQDGGGLAGRGPRRDPPPAAQHPDQLRLAQLPVPAGRGGGGGGERVGEPRAGGEGVQDAAGGEPGAGRAAAQVVQEPGRDRLALAGPRPGEVVRADGGGQPGQPRLIVIRAGLRIAVITWLEVPVGKVVSGPVAAGPVVSRRRPGTGRVQGGGGGGGGRRGARRPGDRAAGRSAGRRDPGPARPGR